VIIIDKSVCKRIVALIGGGFFCVIIYSDKVHEPWEAQTSGTTGGGSEGTCPFVRKL